MKIYTCLISLSLFFIGCSKTANKNNTITGAKTLGTMATAPQNFQLKVLGSKAIFLQPDDHFQYDNMGRVVSAIDSLTGVGGSLNTYPSVPAWSGSGTIPVNINLYWRFYLNGIQSSPNLLRTYQFSSNAAGQITGISDDSSLASESFQYGDKYIVSKFFNKMTAATLYYDSAVFNESDDILSEYSTDFTDTSSPPKHDTLTYSYTGILNPEFYVALFENPSHYYQGMLPAAVSKHMPSRITGIYNNPAPNASTYTYQTDSQGRVLSQTDGKGNLIKTYSYY